MELEKGREKNVLLSALLNKYKTQLKNLKKKLDEEELHGPALLRDPKQSNEKVARIEYNNNLLR